MDTITSNDRRKKGTTTSLIGIIVNLLLFAVKFTVGTLSGSVAVTADSFNNLSDMGSSAVTLLGFKLSGKPADDKHPFGHGRIEYISALVVALIILLLGIELVKSSAEKIISPSDTAFDYIMIGVLLLTIPAKLYLGRIYTATGKKINSTAMSAAAQDSVNDALVTSATIVCALVAKLTSLKIDGYVGVVIAGFVIVSGIGILRDTLGPLLGQKPDKAISEEIERRIKTYDCIIGTHDMIVHNYGPDKYIASVHAEVPADTDIMKMHDIIDLAEREIHEQMGIITTIHLDPIDTDDEKTTELRSFVADILVKISDGLSMHDFRIVSGETHTNLIFDVVVPQTFKLTDVALKEEIDSRVHEVYPNYYTVIIFDRPFI